MSESVSDINSTQSVSDNSSNENQVSLEELQAQIEKLSSTNKRLLDENYKAKQKFNKAKEIEGELEELRKERMTAQERAEHETQKALAMQEELKQSKDRTFKANARATIASLAKDAHDVDDIISQSKFASLLEPTEDGFDVTRESAENLLATLRDKKPHLFARQHVPEMTTENPMVGDPAKKSIKEMSKDEILEARRKRLGLSSF